MGKRQELEARVRLLEERLGRLSMGLLGVAGDLVEAVDHDSLTPAELAEIAAAQRGGGVKTRQQVLIDMAAAMCEVAEATTITLAHGFCGLEETCYTLIAGISPWGLLAEAALRGMCEGVPEESEYTTFRHGARIGAHCTCGDVHERDCPEVSGYHEDGSFERACREVSAEQARPKFIERNPFAKFMCEAGMLAGGTIVRVKVPGLPQYDDEFTLQDLREVRMEDHTEDEQFERACREAFGSSG
jgi:hypothetical protein